MPNFKIETGHNTKTVREKKFGNAAIYINIACNKYHVHYMIGNCGVCEGISGVNSWCNSKLKERVRNLVDYRNKCPNMRSERAIN